MLPNDGVDVVMNDYYLCDCHSGIVRESHQIRSTLENTLRQWGGVWNVWRYAYRKAFIGDMRFKTGYLAEDMDFTVRALVRAKVICVRQPYYIYKYHRDGSITDTASLTYIQQVHELIRRHCRQLGTSIIEKLLKRKLLRDYFMMTARLYDYPSEERKKIRQLYRLTDAPVPFDATLLSPLMVIARKIYHLMR
jgi:hypothetical protein